MKVGADLLEVGVHRSYGKRDTLVNQAYELAALVRQVIQLSAQFIQGFLRF